MSNGPSHPSGVQRELALSLMFAERGGAVVLVADGDTSMVPHLQGGDAVLAVPLAAAEPGRGDLLLFGQQDYWVIHRCLGRAESGDGRRGFRTRGDGRNVLDPHLLAGDVRARVVALRRGGTWRSLEGGWARGYARLLAWHDMTWAVAGVAARKIGLASVVAALDLAVLRVAVPLAFPLFHRRMAPPALASDDGPV
jgi:hypothetical protein